MNSYEILPRPVELGGGWRLRLLEDGEEVGGGVFPLETHAFSDPADALQAAYLDAESEAYCWLDGHPGNIMAPVQGNELFADYPVHCESLGEDSAIATEHRRRRAAVEFALANVELSGFTISETERDRMRSFVDGGMGLDEFVKGLPGHAEGEP